MELLAQAEVHGGVGRWIITPRKGVRFVGSVQRRRVRVRERRRQALTFLLEAIGLTFLIGIVPPLRTLWTVTAVLGVLLLVYAYLLVTIKQRADRPSHQMEVARPPEHAPRRLTERHVAEGTGGRARLRVNGLGLLGEGDAVHVVVRPAAQMGVGGT